MVTGLTGRTGATVLSRVAAECRIDQELVPILHRHLEESRVLGRVKKRDRAMMTPAQVMRNAGFLIHIYTTLVISLVF